MSDEMSHPVTRGELREELAGTKVELRNGLATKEYVDGFAKTILDAFARTNARIDRLEVDLMRHFNSLVDALRAEIRAITEPFQDHGPRIAKLERAVFPDDGGGVRAKARVRRRTSKR